MLTDSLQRSTKLEREIDELAEMDYSAGLGITSIPERGLGVAAEVEDRPLTPDERVIRIDLRPMTRCIRFLPSDRLRGGPGVSANYARGIGRRVAHEFGEQYARGVIESIISAERESKS